MTHESPSIREQLPGGTPNGVLVVDKPTGPTSHDVVSQARRFFKTKRVGHAGTLDPMASGVLIVLLGEGTKLSQALTLERKSYVATITFGSSTDSDDAQGKVLAQASVPLGFLSRSRLEDALDAERQRLSQVPPVVTAIKQNGRKAYERHRQGQVVETPPRDVQVFDLSLLEHTEVDATVQVTVSKGYYVRSLARDLGQALGLPAHLSALRRTSSGEFHLAEAVHWPPLTPPDLLSLEQVVARVLPCRTLTTEGAERARVGKVIGTEHFVPEGEPAGEANSEALAPVAQTTAWLSPNGQLVALGAFDSEGAGRVQRGFGTHQPPKNDSQEDLLEDLQEDSVDS